MAFPLDLFVTDPRMMPRSSTEGAQMLGEWGGQMALDRRARMGMQQAEAHFQQSKNLQERQLQSQDQYRQDQDELRRQAATDKQDHERRQRVQKLLDAFHNPKTTAKDREMLRQELTSLGQSVEEQETELPNLAPPVVSPFDITPQGPPKKEAPGASVSKRQGEPMSAAPDPMGDGFGLGMTNPEPPMGGALGIGAEKPKPRGGKFIVRDEKGNLLSAYDEPLEKNKKRETVRAILDPMIGKASNPQEKAAAEMAQEAAYNAAASDKFDEREAANLGLNVYNREMGRFKTERRPGGVYGAPGVPGAVSRQEQTKQLAMTDDTKDIIFKIDDRHKLPAARDAMGAMSNMDKALDTAHSEGFSGGAAISGYLKAISGAQVSDAEADRIFGGAGKITFWENELNKYTGGGRLPDDLILGLRGVASRAREVFKARSEEAAMKAEGMIDALSTMATPEQKASQKRAARGYFTGDFGGGSGAPAKSSEPDAKRRALEEKLKGMNLD